MINIVKQDIKTSKIKNKSFQNKNKNKAGNVENIKNRQAQVKIYWFL